jgi:Tfp pilus assembly protein PilZ
MPGQLYPRDARVTVNREFGSVAELISEYVTNISRSGVFIRSDSPLPVGTTVNLRFTVIVDELETIEGVGKVVRVADNPKGMGVVFIELSSISQNLVARIMTRAEGVESE